MKKNILLITITGILIASAIYSAGSKNEGSGKKGAVLAAAGSEPVKKAPDKIKLSDTALYYFYGSGCKICKQTDEIVENLRNKYKLTLIKYEIWYNDENRNLLLEIGKQINYEPQGVPLIIFRGIAYFGQTAITGLDAIIGKTDPKKP